MKRCESEIEKAARLANKGKKIYPSRAQVDSIWWSIRQFERATGPLVYIWWTRHEGLRRALYVGMSSIGLCRPLNPNHHQVIVRQYVTDLEFIPCATVEEALALEKDLICKLSPTENRVRPSRSRKRDFR